MSFSKDVRRFTERAKEDLRQVYRQSVSEVFEQAQLERNKGGNMPVKTGDLRNSLTMQDGTKGPESYKPVADKLEFGDTVTGTWTVEYALKVELGHTTSSGANIPGAHFVGTAAAQWSDIVAENAKKVRDKS